MPRRIPKYVRHKARNQGKVTINGRTHYLPGDYDSDESICSRCLGEDALTLVPPSADDDGEADSGAAADLGGHVIVDAAVELVTPRRQGTYRIFFRLVVGTGESMAPVAGCDELFAEFVVVE